MEGDESKLLAVANDLLRETGISQESITSFEELQAISSNLFVGLFEVLFFAELGAVHRAPATAQQREDNANIVLDALQQVLRSTIQMPPTITGRAIQQGDKPAIVYLLRLFSELLQQTSDQERRDLLHSAAVSQAPEGSDANAPPARPQRNPRRRRSAARKRPKSAAKKAPRSTRRRPASRPTRRAPHTAQAASCTAPSPAPAPHTTAFPDLQERPAPAPGTESEPGTSWRDALMEGGRAEGMAVSGEGLGPNGRPGTAVGGSRGQVWRAMQEQGPAPTEPSPSPATVDIWAEGSSGTSSAAGSVAGGGRAEAKAASPASARQGTVPITVRGAVTGATAVDLLSAEDLEGQAGATLRRQRRPPKARRGKTAPPASKSYTALRAARAAALKRSARAQRAAARREAAEAAAAKARLSAAHQSVVRDRAAKWRVREARFLKRASRRAAAAKHDRKVLTIQTARVLEDLQRQTLSLRLARASQQAAITAQYTRAIAEQERAAVREASQAAAADAAAGRAALEMQQEAALHTLAVRQQLLREAAEAQAADLAVASAGQAEALRSSRQDILSAGRAAEAAAASLRQQKEAQWRVANLAPADAGEVRPMGAVLPPAVAAARQQWLAEGAVGGEEDSFLQHAGVQVEGGEDSDEGGWMHSVSAPASELLQNPAYTARAVPDTTTSRRGMVVTQHNAGLTPGDKPRLLNVRGATFTRTSTGGGGGGYLGTRTAWM